MKLNPKHTSGIYWIAIAVCFMPFMEAAYALLLGVLLSLIGIMKQEKLNRLTGLSLQTAIVLMGLGMNLTQAMEASSKGFFITVISVIGTLVLGIGLAKLLKVEEKIGVLISSGTAICGGSAIASVSPVIKSKDYQVSVALIVVFLLNAVALFVFPAIGHLLKLSQSQFGYWAAIAIHDTSSVVGAAHSYGEQALEIATAVKLTRALWIIPVSICFAFIYEKKDKNGGTEKGKIKIPWFIGLYVLAILANHYFTGSAVQDTFMHLNWLGKRLMVVALFLIGSNISISQCKQAGMKSFVLGILLWLAISSLTLMVVLKGGFC